MNKHAGANMQIPKAVIINPSSLSKTFIFLLCTFIAEAGNILYPEGEFNIEGQGLFSGELCEKENCHLPEGRGFSKVFSEIFVLKETISMLTIY